MQFLSKILHLFSELFLTCRVRTVSDGTERNVPDIEQTYCDVLKKEDDGPSVRRFPLLLRNDSKLHFFVCVTDVLFYSCPLPNFS